MSNIHAKLQSLTDFYLSKSVSKSAYVPFSVYPLRRWTVSINISCVSVFSQAIDMIGLKLVFDLVSGIRFGLNTNHFSKENAIRLVIVAYTYITHTTYRAIHALGRSHTLHNTHIRALTVLHSVRPHFQPNKKQRVNFDWNPLWPCIGMRPKWQLHRHNLASFLALMFLPWC